MAAFLLLGVIWAAVLLPPWLQSRREARPTASIVNFRRQLWSLARTSPGHGPDLLYSDIGAGGSDAGDVYAGDVYAGDVYAGDVYAGDVYAGDLDGFDSVDERAEVVAFWGPRAPATSPAREQPRATGGAYRRRRRVLGGLTVLALGTVAPAVVLGGAWLIVQAVSGGLLVTYVGLLVRRHRRLVEQAQKVRYLAPIRAPGPAVVVLGGQARADAVR